MLPELVAGIEIDSPEEVLRRFKEKHKKLMDLNPEVEVSKVYESFGDFHHFVYQPPLIEITVKHPFIFDNRLIPRNFENLKVKNLPIGEAPEGFYPDEDGVPLWEVYNPQKYIDFVEDNADFIRAELKALDLSKAEILDALTGGWNAYLYGVYYYKWIYARYYGALFFSQLNYRTITIDIKDVRMTDHGIMKSVEKEHFLLSHLNKHFHSMYRSGEDFSLFAQAASLLQNVILESRKRNFSYIPSNLAHKVEEPFAHPDFKEKIKLYGELIAKIESAVKSGNYEEAATLNFKKNQIEEALDRHYIREERYFRHGKNDNEIIYQLTGTPADVILANALNQDLYIDKLNSLIANYILDLPVEVADTSKLVLIAVGKVGLSCAAYACALKPHCFNLYNVNSLAKLKKVASNLQSKNVLIVSGFSSEKETAFTNMLILELGKLLPPDQIGLIGKNPADSSTSCPFGNLSLENYKKKMFSEHISQEKILSDNPSLKKKHLINWDKVFTVLLAEKICEYAENLMCDWEEDN